MAVVELEMDAVPAVRTKRLTRGAVLRFVVVVVVVVVLAFALKGFPLGAALAKIRSLSVDTLLIVLGAALLQVAAQISRLWLVFPSDCRPSWMRVARGFSFGQLMNMSLPARAGDVLKVVIIARDPTQVCSEPRAAVTQATGALLADKVLDIGTTLTLGLTLGGALLLRAMPSALSLSLSLFAAGIIAAVVAAAFVLKRWFPGSFQKVRDVGIALAASVRALRCPKRLTRGVLVGCLALGAEVVGLMVLSSALGVGLSIGGAVSVLVVLGVGIAVPLSVGNIGPFEASIAFGMSQFGVSTANAIAIGTVHHAAQFAAVAIAALVFWRRDRQKRRDRRLAAQRSVQTTAALASPPERGRLRAGEVGCRTI